MLPAYAEGINCFADTADNFCRIIDRRHELAFDELILELDAVLPLLYLNARNLAAAAPPDLFQAQPSGSDDNIDFQELIRGDASPSDNEHIELAEDLTLIFEVDDTHYIGVNYTPASLAPESDTEPRDTDVLWHSNGEELAQVYVSLRDGLATFRRGQPQDIEQAGWDWLFGFYSVWGEFVPHLIQETFRLAHATISDEEKSVGL